ncbi:MAG: hypothetical protein RIQ90_1856 [Bacteroidota bacterium]|jgi:hypothetical protein
MKTGFYALLFLFTLGCGKAPKTLLLEGVVTDNSFNVPLSGATVTLYGVSATTNQFSQIGTTTTDAQGYYRFEFERTRTEKYTVKITKPLYFDIENDINNSALNLKGATVRNYATTAKSWAEIRILNHNPSNTDHLQYLRQAGKLNCDECCTNEIKHFYGAADTSLYCINDGNSPYRIEYGVYGTNNSGILEVITAPFDTTTIYLGY